MNGDPHGVVDERVEGRCRQGTGPGEADKVRVGLGEEARGVGEAEEVAGPPEEAGGGCSGGGVGARGGVQEGRRRRRSVRGYGAIGDEDGQWRRRHRRPELQVRRTMDYAKRKKSNWLRLARGETYGDGLLFRFVGV